MHQGIEVRTCKQSRFQMFPKPPSLCRFSEKICLKSVKRGRFRRGVACMSNIYYYRLSQTMSHIYRDKSLNRYNKFHLSRVKGRDGWTSVKSSLSGVFCSFFFSLLRCSCHFFLRICLQSCCTQRSCFCYCRLDFRLMSLLFWDVHSPLSLSLRLSLHHKNRVYCRRQTETFDIT